MAKGASNSVVRFKRGLKLEDFKIVDFKNEDEKILWFF